MVLHRHCKSGKIRCLDVILQSVGVRKRRFGKADLDKALANAAYSRAIKEKFALAALLGEDRQAAVRCVRHHFQTLRRRHR